MYKILIITALSLSVIILSVRMGSHATRIEILEQHVMELQSECHKGKVCNE